MGRVAAGAGYPPQKFRKPVSRESFEILLLRSGRYPRQLTMDIEILDQEENPLLHRTEVSFEIVHDEATPSRLSVRDSLAAKLDKDSDEVVVQALDTKFGMRKTIGSAKVYESADVAMDIEQEHMLERNHIGQEEAEEDEAEEAAAE